MLAKKPWAINKPQSWKPWKLRWRTGRELPTPTPAPSLSHSSGRGQQQKAVLSPRSEREGWPDQLHHLSPSSTQSPLLLLSHSFALSFCASLCASSVQKHHHRQLATPLVGSPPLPRPIPGSSPHPSANIFARVALSTPKTPKRVWGRSGGERQGESRTFHVLDREFSMLLGPWNLEKLLVATNGVEVERKRAGGVGGVGRFYVCTQSGRGTEINWSLAQHLPHYVSTSNGNCCLFFLPPSSHPRAPVEPCLCAWRILEYNGVWVNRNIYFIYLLYFILHL